MKIITQHILLFILVLSSSFIQGQSKHNILESQIVELKEHRNFITESACPQKEEISKTYQTNFESLFEILNISSMVYNTPLTIEKDRIKKQEDKTITYQSTNITNVKVKRYSPRISMAGIVSDNSSIPIGARLLTETFTVNKKEIEARYRIIKNNIYLISLEAIYPNKTRVYLDLTSMPQSDFRVYNTSEFGTEFKKIQIYFSPFEIGKINLLRVNEGSYDLYREQYTEMSKDTPNQGFIRHRYAIRCTDEKGDYITPTKVGNNLTIKPTTYLLWYKGFIGKYPIKLMLKRGFVKEKDGFKINDTIITDVQYAYDNQKKWININALGERQSGIFGFEGQDDSPEWSVKFEYNRVLKGDWDNQNGTILPVSLTPMTKEFPTFSFKAKIEEELTPAGKVENKIVRGITIYKNKKLVQEIKNEDGSSLDYFELGYVDINYDGYLDLFINDKLYFYNPSTKKFIVNNEDDYYPYLSELGQYNLFTKSFISQMNRTMLEYRAIKGKLTPYHSSSYYPNKDGDMVMHEEKYVNGKWITVSKDIEIMEEEDEVDVVEDDIDIGSSKNYALNIDLTESEGTLLFTPTFYNKTGVEFKQKAKLFVEMKDTDDKIHRQFLYKFSLNGDKEEILDDSYILFNGNYYFLEHYDAALIPFFSPHLSKGTYTFQLVVEHPLFGRVVSKNQSIELPLQLKKDTTIKQFKGSINNKVVGSIYFKVNDKKVIGTFINAKTGKNINLKGTYTNDFFGVDTLNLEEYENEEKLSGYFEGTITNIKGENKGIYKGYWISPNKIIRVPFKFKNKKYIKTKK